MAGFKSVTASKLGTSAAHLPCRGGRPRKLRQHSHKMAAAAELRARGVAVAGGGGGPSAALQSGASDSVPRPSRGGPNASGFFLKSSPVPAGQRGPTPPGAASGSRSTTVSQRESRRLFYDEVPQRMLPPVPWRSPLDHEIGLLFLPALVAGVLEPIQQTTESILVGKLGVSQLGALGLGTVLFQFAVGFFACLVFATTPRVAAHADSKRRASQATAKGMWIALVTGVALQLLVWWKAPDVVAYMSGSDAVVASLALIYLRARSWGLPAALIMMVAIGAGRGVKDMNVQLLGSLAYLAALVVADAALLFGPPALGMEGAGLGAAAAQWAGAITVCALLHRKQIFRLSDMASLPGPADVRPYARMTGSLVLNNLSALLPTLVATSAATGLGVQSLGAHTILRQLMGFWLQLFVAFNATAHSLIATNLSRQREGRAAQVLVRIAQLAVGVSLPLAAALFLARGSLPGLFTGDSGVQGEVAEVLPLLLVLMPLDALGTVLEGGLLGASDTGYLGARTAASCAVSLAALGAAALGHGGLLAVWAGMKCLNVCALAFDLAKFWLGGGAPPRAPPQQLPPPRRRD